MDNKKFFPTSGRQLLTGGLNDKYEPSIIANNESPDCLNVVFTSGIVSTRQGVKLLNTTPISSFACDGIYSYRNDQNQESMCVFFGGNMYSLSGTTFYTVPSAQGVFVAGTRLGSEQAENYIFFGNGNSIPYKYNGAFTRHGVYPPTQTATVASNGVGVLSASGGYLYGYTYVNTNLVESNLSPISTTFTISTTSGQNTVANIATAPLSWGINNGYLYRTKAGQTTPFYRVTTFPNGTTSVVDNVSDASLTIQSSTNNGVPPNYTTIVYAQSLLFCNDANNPNFLWYSNAGNPYTFPTTNFLKVGDNTSDLIKGLYYWNQALIIFCEKSIWFLYLTDASPNDWVGPFRSTSSYGSKSPYGLVTYNNKILFPAMYNQQFVGFGALSGNVLDTNKTVLTVSAAGSDLKTDRLEPDMYAVQSAFVQNISATVYKKKAWIAVTYGAGASSNNRVYQADFSASTINPDQEFSWCPFTFAGTGPNPAQFCVYQGGLYYGTADATGQVYQCESGNYDDAGHAINSYFWTKEFVGQDDPGGSDTNMVKNFRYANILIDSEGSYNMNFAYRVDSDKSLTGVVQQVSVNPGGTTWGSSQPMTWGVSIWGGGPNQIEPRLFLANARGKRIQFQFNNQNVADQKFGVHGLNFFYVPVGFR